MKVLIIEDGRHLAERLKHLLGRDYIVDTVTTGEEGLCLATTIDYMVIILDLGLPDMPGVKVCERLREDGITTPILILTGTDDVTSRVQLLDCGADDYITKPFNSAELHARVAALARRHSREYLQDTITLKDLEMNMGRREVRRSGVLIALRRKEFDILRYLVSNRGRAVSRQMIINHAWENDKESWPNTVDVHIKHLRDKIDRPFLFPLIKTAYGIGYMVDDAS